MKEKNKLILRNGKVFTADAANPWAESIAIQGNEFAAVGKDEDIKALMGSDVKIIDLGGKVVLPGFNDAHTHYIGALIREAAAFDLHGVHSILAAQERLHAFSVEHPDREWIYGRRWDINKFEAGKFPTRYDLDRVESQRPIAIKDIDGHSAWVNTVALERLGIDKDSIDPEGGKIVRDAQGEPTGILLEAAGEAIPPTALPEDVQFSQLLKDGVSSLNRLGITSLSNNGVREDHLEEIIRLSEGGELNLRINEWPTLDENLDPVIQLREKLKGNEKIRIVGLKSFIDGVLSSHTAWMLDPYEDDPRNIGFPMMELERLAKLVVAADREGFQVFVHAIGDRAVRETLHIYEQAMNINGRRDSRHRIEHVEVAHPDDQARFVSLGVIPSMQPLHCSACIEDYLIDRLGEPRGGTAYPWRYFVDSNAHLCFGTDWPAIDMLEPNPLENIFGAVTRTLPEYFGKPIWHPEQRLTLDQALRCYTVEGAYAEFMEDRKGTISTGKLADLCVLDRDIFTEDPFALLDAKVRMTIFDGQIVYQDF